MKGEMFQKTYTANLFLFFLLVTLLNPLELLSQNDDPNVITVLVLYTEEEKDFADANNGGIDNTIAQCIAYTNQVFNNSDLNVEVELVYSAMVDYESTGDSSLNLQRLGDTDDGYMDEIHELRNRKNADLVTLIGGGGLPRGYLPQSPHPNYGFSITFGYPEIFAHELGHNFGFHHSRNQNSETAPSDGGMFEYSTGWRWKDNNDRGYVSIMTYPEGDTEVPYYSNPNINYKGVPTGSYIGEYAPADNARTLREVKEYIAGYRGPAHEGDSLAVISLYNNANGQSWKNQTNWLANKPMRTWHGLNVMGRVVELNLGDNNLTGSFPSEIFDLTNLWHLRLSNNNLSGEIPPEIGQMTKLRTLGMNSNNLSKPIPTEIGKLANLEYLKLGNNRLTGNIPSEISQLPKLKSLSIYNNDISGSLPYELASISSLESLNLADNRLKGSVPSELGNLSRLNRLWLQNNNLRGPVPLSFTKLNELNNLLFYGTYLCIPSNQDFLDWLENLENVNGTGVMCEDVQPGEFALEVPANNSNNQSLSPLLQWTQSENAENYHVQVSKSEDFSDLIVDSSDVQNSDFQMVNLDEVNTYYWRVRATTDYLDSEWTTTWSFTTSDAPPPENVTLSTQGDDVELNWTPIDSDLITSYLIYKGETTASMELYETIDPGQSTFAEESSQGSSFYAVSAEYGEGIQSKITTIMSYYYDIQTISDSWKLVSAPVQGQELNFKNADLFGFDRIYKREETLLPGKGYWIRSDNTKELDLAGEGLIQTEVELKSGWNLVGGIADVISTESIRDPSGILRKTPIYEYSGSSYSQVSTLEPGKGYWIYANENGMIELKHGEPQVSIKRKKKDLLTDIDALNFRSGTASQTFWVSEQPIDKDERLSFLLPPKAPEPIIDVRTTDGYAIGDENRLVIDITAASFPVEVTAQMNQHESRDYAYRIMGIEDGREAHFNLSASKAVRVEKNYDKFYLERIQEDELINEYSLYSNYPNPFNPSTNISYQLPKESHVEVEVFDVAGRKVASLVNATQKSGIYTVRFNGSNQASGIYFLRFQAEEFIGIQKLTLIK